jgi:hypothetical protein
MSDNLQEITFMPSTIETIDFALYDWLNEKMDIYATSESGWKKVPITWVSAERAHQIKYNKDIRDSSGMVKLPLITIERKTINKDPTKTGSIPANLRPINDEKGGTVTIARRINQEKTSNFATADQTKRTTLAQTESRSIYRRDNRVFPLYENRNARRQTNKVVYQTITIPIPVHVNVQYQINIRTDYLQQLNEITTPFYTKNGNTRYIQLTREEHRYDAFIKGEFAYENNASNLNEERKNYSASVTIEVLGYLIGEDKNQETPKFVIRENAVEVKFPRERVIMGDIPDFVNSAKNKTSYRE